VNRQQPIKIGTVADIRHDNVKTKHQQKQKQADHFRE
jgi:hypothetical protein